MKIKMTMNFTIPWKCPKVLPVINTYELFEAKILFILKSIPPIYFIIIFFLVLNFLLKQL